MGDLISKPKRMKDKNGIDLRVLTHGRDVHQAALAENELRRRLRNLEGACIPPWELAARGPRPSAWEILV